MKGVNLSQASILSVLVPCLVLANPLPAPDVSAKRDLTGVVCSGNVVVDFNGADACAYYLRSLGKNQCQVATGVSTAAQSSQVCHSSDVSISMVLNPATLSDYLPNASMYCGKIADYISSINNTCTFSGGSALQGGSQYVNSADIIGSDGFSTTNAALQITVEYG